MARMIPAQIDNNNGSSAEENLFRQFARQLPNDYVVLHSVGWLNRQRGEAYRTGEADFVIVHPLRGVLVLEVKGGRIRGNSANQEWESEDRHGQQHRINNPIRQAQRSMYALSAKLKDNPDTAPFDYALSWGVAFPDVLTGKQQFGVNFDRSMLIDGSHLNDLTSAVDRLFGPPDPANRLNNAAIDAIIRLLATPVTVERLGLLSEIQQDEEIIHRLTEQQFGLLRALRTTRQGAINGCAGSGKTMLAIEKARQLAEEGSEVLLTCYNKALAAWIREGVARQTSPAMKRITVLHYHDLARILTEGAGVSLAGRFGEKDFWEETLPSLFADAIPDIQTRYDAIIADEGQDFATEWWFTLRELLRDPNSGVFYIFQDARQALYRGQEDLPVPVMTLELTDNCRNTARIHELGVVYTQDAPRLESRGPQGRTVEHIDDSETGLLRAVRRILARLIDQEGFTSGQIVILTPASESRSVLTTGTMLGNRRLTRDAPASANDIQVSTVHGFKGLESPVVILAEMDRIPAYVRSPDHLLYVAITRAKHHLIVVGSLPEPQSRRETTVA